MLHVLRGQLAMFAAHATREESLQVSKISEEQRIKRKLRCAGQWGFFVLGALSLVKPSTFNKTCTRISKAQLMAEPFPLTYLFSNSLL